MKNQNDPVETVIAAIRNRTNPSFEEWASYGISPEDFILAVRWLSEETQQERSGRLQWARAVGLTVPHVIVRTLGGSWKLQQTGPAVLHRLINKIHTATGLALISDFDTNESWGYHTWPHLTLQDIIDGKRYPLEQSNHPHPELEKYKYPDRSGDRF